MPRHFRHLDRLSIDVQNVKDEAGTVVKVEGWAARSGKPAANTNTITLPDGRRLFAGSPAGESPPK